MERFWIKILFFGTKKREWLDSKVANMLGTTIVRKLLNCFMICTYAHTTNPWQYSWKNPAYRTLRLFFTVTLYTLTVFKLVRTIINPTAVDHPKKYIYNRSLLLLTENVARQRCCRFCKGRKNILLTPFLTKYWWTQELIFVPCLLCG